MPNLSDLPKFLTTKQLAELLDLSAETLANERYLGVGIPYYKVGKRVRYSLDDVIAYLEANRVSNGS